jgi:hypothetical protein
MASRTGKEPRMLTRQAVANRLEDIQRKRYGAEGMAQKPEDALNAKWAKPLDGEPWMKPLAEAMLWFARNNDPFVDGDWPYNNLDAKLTEPLPQGMTIEQAVQKVDDILRQVGDRPSGALDAVGTAHWAARLRHDDTPWMLPVAELMVAFTRRNDPFVTGKWPLRQLAKTVKATQCELPPGTTLNEAVVQVANALREIGTQTWKQDPSDPNSADWAQPLRQVGTTWMLPLAGTMVTFARDTDPFVTGNWPYEVFTTALAEKAAKGTKGSAAYVLPQGLTIEQAVAQVEAILRQRWTRDGMGDPTWYELNVAWPLAKKRARLDGGALPLDAADGDPDTVLARVAGATYYDSLDTSQPLRQVVLHTDLEGVRDTANDNRNKAAAALRTAEEPAQKKWLAQKRLERDLWASVGALSALIITDTGGDSQRIDEVLSTLSDDSTAARSAGRPQGALPLLQQAVRTAAPDRADDIGFCQEVGDLLLHCATGTH